jgi:hypothetical protein
LNDNVDFNRAWKSIREKCEISGSHSGKYEEDSHLIRENIKTSAKENLGHELKKHKSWFLKGF